MGIFDGFCAIERAIIKMAIRRKGSIALSDTGKGLGFGQVYIGHQHVNAMKDSEHRIERMSQTFPTSMWSPF